MPPCHARLWIALSPMVLASAAAGWNAIPDAPAPSTMRITAASCEAPPGFDYAAEESTRRGPEGPRRAFNDET